MTPLPKGVKGESPPWNGC